MGDQDLSIVPVESWLMQISMMVKKWGISVRQGGITCGAINEPRKSSKTIINFRDKNVVIARFRDKWDGNITL